MSTLADSACIVIHLGNVIMPWHSDRKLLFHCHLLTRMNKWGARETRGEMAMTIRRAINLWDHEGEWYYKSQYWEKGL